jgi:micrococcal nuclease
MQQEIISAGLALLFVLAAFNVVGQQNSQPKAQVVEVVDGDTVDVNLDNRKETIRILGIDTPEVHGQNIPGEYFLENTSENRRCLRNIGQKASQYAKQKMSNREVRVVQDPKSDTRGSYGRLLAYIEYNQTDLGKKLLEKGYARVYNSSFTRIEEYRELETQSREAGIGIWNESCGVSH